MASTRPSRYIFVAGVFGSLTRFEVMMRSLAYAFALALALPVAAAAQAKDSLPPGVTPDMVKEGKTLFAGAGICAACHGTDAKGMPGLGANLTDNKWLHSDGSYDAIVKQIMTGVTASQSTSGAAMPARGGSALTDAQVQAVAAYVWSLSHRENK
jgi:cbb3-type cytochrome c oxidase subunit III